MASRRAFLLGLGGLVTASFVTRATRHIREASTPLLLNPGRAEETLYVYDQSGWDDDYKWRVTLGPEVYPPPPAPTWRDYLQLRGYRLDTEADWDRVGLERSEIDLDSHLDGYGWQSEWDHLHSPQAKAAILLKELKLDCALDEEGRKAGRIAFTEWGGHPGSCEQWVDLRDDLTVSLLQARLLETGHPIRVLVGEL